MERKFIKAHKVITSQPLLSQFLRSGTCQNYLKFLHSLALSARSLPLSHKCAVTPIVERLTSMLDTMQSWVAEIPPIKQPMRYGNKAFREWLTRLQERAETLVATVVANEELLAQGVAVELASYLIDSVGNITRIDYGTGHETTFVAFLWCFVLLELVKPEDFPAIVLKVFQKYLSLMRTIQQTYMLEPAGSHGVWSLDDYHFLVFYFGASQLIDHPIITPKNALEREYSRTYAHEYMYLAALEFIHEVKSGPFFEHSPILTSVGEVHAWQKVMEGLTKMYKAEVLNKFPIMQHFLFGSIIRFEAAEGENSSKQKLVV